MDIAGQVTLPALLVALLGPLLGLSVSLAQSARSVDDTLPSGGPTWESDMAQLLFPLLCTQPSPSSTPPSSVHALRPSDITLVSAVGLPHSHRIEMLRFFDVLSMFNPALTKLLPDQTSVQSPQQRSLSEQAEDMVHSLQAKSSNEDWKLLLLVVPVDELCLCPEQANTAVTDTVQRVDEVLSKLQSQLKNTLISAVVWAGTSDDVRDAQQDSTCNCELSESKAELRMKRAIFAEALQESLESHLQTKQWYSGREDFTVMLQPSPMFMDMLKSRVPPSGIKAENIDHVPLNLLRNLLQPVKWLPDRWDSDIIGKPCPGEDQPLLRTQRNSPSELLSPRGRSIIPARMLDPITGTEFPCEDLSPSNSIPTSVHALRPGDIKVVAALGDSLTAGNGVGAAPNNLLGVMLEYRGLSWSIGGDGNLTNVTTLPNILRQFNPSLTGFSEGIGDVNSSTAFLNQAVPGAKSEDMPGQARRLVDKMKNDQRINFQNDWKVITFFIGGNDLCDYCKDTIHHSPENISSRIREALDILHREVPRALVNLVELNYLVPLRALVLDSSLQCPLPILQNLCSCVVTPADGSVELQQVIDQNRAYQREMQELAASGRYDTQSNFTVVLQPFFREVVLPLENGRPDRTYFAPDCFHLSQRGQTLMARALWNNMLEPVGNKTNANNFSLGVSLICPSEAEPLIRTSVNSNNTDKGPEPTPSPVTLGSDFSCTDLAPSDPVPTSVHRLRPADIKVVAALGDSLTAGFGAKSKNISELKTEYRGVSWSIGGDKTLEEVGTLPNILRKFNSSLNGFSIGVGTNQSGFNMAVSGSKASDIPDQARRLIEALNKSEDVDYANDWKIVTLFVGLYDLCQYCSNRTQFSPQNYSFHLQESLDILSQIPRMLVSVVEILQVTKLRSIRSDTPGCSVLEEYDCPCVINPAEDSPELNEMLTINRQYQEESERLVSGGRYDGREDFAVITQPFLRNTTIPLNSMQKPDASFFSVDCFHFSERGHSEMAINLWNNMLEPEGKKQTSNNFTTDRNKLKCPTQNQPYIFTRVNSKATTVACSMWAATLLAVIGLRLAGE